MTCRIYIQYRKCIHNIKFGILKRHEKWYFAHVHFHNVIRAYTYTINLRLFSRENICVEKIKTQCHQIIHFRHSKMIKINTYIIFIFMTVCLSQITITIKYLLLWFFNISLISCRMLRQSKTWTKQESYERC